MTLDVEAVRAAFPVLEQRVGGHALAYLDSASTALTPRPVVEAMRRYYERDNANIHRGVHTLSRRATDAFEASRAAVAGFLGAASPDEIVFTRGSTEGLNLLAATLGADLGPDDEVLVTELEHHSNLVPWMRLCERSGASLRVWRLDAQGGLPLDDLDALVSSRTRIAAVAHVSNALGTVVPLSELADRVHGVGGVVVVDGAQAVPHRPVQVWASGADFYVFSGHKLYGPTGAGVLWGREDRLAALPPWQSGGEMIHAVSFEDGVEYAELPHRFEAGTPDIAAVIGLGAALEWVQQVGLPNIAAHEAVLLEHLQAGLAELPEVQLVGTAPGKLAVQAFLLSGVHAHDVGTILDTLGVAVRTGHHCAEPAMRRFGVEASVRVSFGAYSTLGEVERLVAGLHEVRRIMGR